MQTAEPQPKKPNWRRNLIQGSIVAIVGVVLLFTPLHEWGLICVVLGLLFVLIGLWQLRKAKKAERPKRVI